MFQPSSLVMCVCLCVSFYLKYCHKKSLWYLVFSIIPLVWPYWNVLSNDGLTASQENTVQLGHLSFSTNLNFSPPPRHPQTPTWPLLGQYQPEPRDPRCLGQWAAGWVFFSLLLSQSGPGLAVVSWEMWESSQCRHRVESLACSGSRFRDPRESRDRQREQLTSRFIGKNVYNDRDYIGAQL